MPELGKEKPESRISGAMPNVRPIIVVGSDGSGMPSAVRALLEMGVDIGDEFLIEAGDRQEMPYRDVAWAELHNHAMRIWPKEHGGFPAPASPRLRTRFIRVVQALAKAKSARAAERGRSSWGLADTNSIFFLDLYREALPDAVYMVCESDLAPENALDFE